jgi:hypothetical protein
MFSRFFSRLVQTLSTDHDKRALERRLAQSSSLQEVEYIQRHWHAHRGQFPLSH